MSCLLICFMSGLLGEYRGASGDVVNVSLTAL